MSEKEREININEFNPQSIPDSCTWIVVAAPSKGKTTFIEDLCYWNKHRYPVVRVWCGTEDTQGKYSKFGEPIFITNDYKADEHEKSIVRQKLCIAEKCHNPKGIYIIDDCNLDRSVFNSKIMKAQFKNGTQWWNCLFIIGSHYVFDLPPDVRKCVSYVAIFQEQSIAERKKLYDTFAIGCTPTEFNQLMDELTEDYNCLIFHKQSKSNKLEDCVFYYKARIHGNWKLGCEESKKWNADRYDKKYVEQYI